MVHCIYQRVTCYNFQIKFQIPISFSEGCFSFLCKQCRPCMIKCCIMKCKKICKITQHAFLLLFQVHIAAANGYIDVLEFLLDHHASLNIRDYDSWLPIHAAACWLQVCTIFFYKNRKKIVIISYLFMKGCVVVLIWKYLHFGSNPLMNL